MESAQTLGDGNRISRRTVRRVYRDGGARRNPDGELEHRTIDGIAVEGRSASKTIPAGEIGNERPITIASQEWTSPELKVLFVVRPSPFRMLCCHGPAKD
jgi:hypothetical protein